MTPREALKYWPNPGGIIEELEMHGFVIVPKEPERERFELARALEQEKAEVNRLRKLCAERPPYIIPEPFEPK